MRQLIEKCRERGRFEDESIGWSEEMVMDRTEISRSFKGVSR